MTTRRIQKHIKKQLARFMLVTGALLLVLQTSPVYCGFCLIGECRHRASMYDPFGDKVFHDTRQEMKCCANESGKKIKLSETGTDNFPSCNCILVSGIEDKLINTSMFSAPVRVLFSSEFADSFYISFKPGRHLFLNFSTSRVQSNPIFILNSTFLI